MRRLKSAVSLDTLFKSTDWKISSHPYGLIINWEIEIRFLFFVLRWKQLGVQAGSFTCWQWRSFRRSPRRAPGVPPGLLIWRLRAISRVQQCFTLFFFSLRPCEGGKKSDTNNLGVVSSHSSSAKQSRTGWVLGRWSVRPAHPAGQWQHINQTNSGSSGSSSRGLSFTHLINHRAAHNPDRPASC